MDYTPLSTILARGDKSISPRALYNLQQPLVEALMEWRDSGSTGQQLSAQTVELSNDGKHIRLVDASSLEKENIASYGRLLLTAIDHSTLRDKRLRHIAEQCASSHVANLETVHLLLERMVSSTIYRLLLAIIIAGCAILASYQLLH